MSEELITLTAGATLLGISYCSLIALYQGHTVGLPVAVAKKARGNTNLYRKSDFLDYAKTKGVRKGLDNNLARLYLTGKLRRHPC